MSKKIYHQVAVASNNFNYIGSWIANLGRKRYNLFCNYPSFNCRIGRTNGKTRGGIGIDFHHS